MWANAAQIAYLESSYPYTDQCYHKPRFGYTLHCKCSNQCNGKLAISFHPGKLLLAIRAWQNINWNEISRIFCAHDADGKPYEYSHLCLFQNCCCGVEGHGALEPLGVNRRRKPCQHGKQLCAPGLHGEYGPCLVNPPNSRIYDDNIKLVGWGPPIPVRSFAPEPSLRSTPPSAPPVGSFEFPLPPNEALEPDTEPVAMSISGSESEAEEESATPPPPANPPRGSRMRIPQAEKVAVYRWMDRHRNIRCSLAGDLIDEACNETGVMEGRLRGIVSNTKRNMMTDDAAGNLVWVKRPF